MDKEIVEMLCKKYNKSEKMIRNLILISFEEGYSLEELKELIENFYIKQK